MITRLICWWKGHDWQYRYVYFEETMEQRIANWRRASAIKDRWRECDRCGTAEKSY